MIRKEDILPEDVLKCYGFDGAVELRRLAGTRNKNYHVRDAASGRAIFLRRRHAAYSSRQWLSYDHRASIYLYERQAPVLRPLQPAGQSQTWIEHETGIYEAYPFLNGQSFCAQQPGQIAAVATALGQLHRVGGGFDLLFQKGGYARGENCPRRLLQVARQVESSAADATLVVSEYVDAVRLAGEKLPDEVYHCFPATVNHGDVHPGNIIMAEDRVAAFVDLDWICQYPVLHDLAYALIFVCSEKESSQAEDIWSLTQPFRFVPARIAEFLSAYTESAGGLSSAAVSHLPAQMMLTWAHSRLDGALKVPAARRREFLEREYQEPFRWLQEHYAWFRGLVDSSS